MSCVYKINIIKSILIFSVTLINFY